MATLHVQCAVVNVGGGTYTVEVRVKDDTGAVIDAAESGPVEIPVGEVVTLDVTPPVVSVRDKGPKGPRGGGS